MNRTVKIIGILLSVIISFIIAGLIIIGITDISREYERRAEYGNMVDNYTAGMKEDYEGHKEDFLTIKGYFLQNRNHARISADEWNSGAAATVISDMYETEYPAFDRLFNELGYQSVEYYGDSKDSGYIVFVKTSYTQVTDKILAQDIYMWGTASVCYNSPYYDQYSEYPYEVLDESDDKIWSVYFDQRFGA